MQHARMIGNYIYNLAAMQDFSKEHLAEKLSCTDQQIEDFFAGRYILPFWKLQKLSEIFNISVSQILDGDIEQYNRQVVHCMNDFDDPENRELILDIIDDYLDIREAASH